MIQITKIFRFEMAHAIYGYAGKCKNIHGHSYVLYVTVASKNKEDNFINPPGFIYDFKQLKKIVNDAVITKLDHQLVLSEDFLSMNDFFKSIENIFTWDIEPSAENILLFIKQNLEPALPEEIILTGLKLFETADSFAEWIR